MNVILYKHRKHEKINGSFNLIIFSREYDHSLTHKHSQKNVKIQTCIVTALNYTLQAYSSLVTIRVCHTGARMRYILPQSQYISICNSNLFSQNGYIILLLMRYRYLLHKQWLTYSTHLKKVFYCNDGCLMEFMTLSKCSSFFCG